VFTAAVRERLAAEERLVDPRKYTAAGRDAIAAEVTRLLGVLDCPPGETAARDLREARG
jgi:fructose/tagatose bisphosphate aldolase